MHIHSMEPEDTDIINIESSLNKTASVSFKINNKIK